MGPGGSSARTRYPRPQIETGFPRLLDWLVVNLAGAPICLADGPALGDFGLTGAALRDGDRSDRSAIIGGARRMCWIGARMLWPQTEGPGGGLSLVHSEPTLMPSLTKQVGAQSCRVHR